MKKMRRLIPAIAMLLVSAVMLSTASFAWFTVSNSAKAEGMTVSAMAASSLLIVNSHTRGAGQPDSLFTTTTGVATLSARQGTNLQPATHYVSGTHTNVTNGAGETVATPAGGLVYIGNTAEVVDPATGTATGDIEWKEAVDSTHYIDYTIWLGTSGQAKTGALSATVFCTNETVAEIHNAIAIDFLVENAEGQVVYVADATAWLADAKTDAGSTVSLGNVTIPVAVATAENATEASETGEYLIVTMRVYFDGNKTADGKAYVRDANATQTTCSFNVLFEIN